MKYKKILVIDDDCEDSELFEEALKLIDENIKCNTAKDGEDALKKLDEDTGGLPDLIFLDLNMPRMNGKKCLAEIKKRNGLKDIPVIICSTSKTVQDEEETKKLGAVYFLKKPASFKDLGRSLKYILLENWEAHRV